MMNLVKIGGIFGSALLIGWMIPQPHVLRNGNPIDVVQETFLGYPIQPVSVRDVVITDGFWHPILKTIQEKTIPYAIKKCAEEGRFDNFLIAGGKMQGTVKGEMPFDDTDVYKIIEGASTTLISMPNPKLEKTLDSIIDIIKVGQEADGYLTTWRTINPAKPPAEWVKVDRGVRWESMFMSHEDYNAGHLYEAAAQHYYATGKRNFLDIALKNADLFVQTFGPGRLKNVPGHQIIETGLIKLYNITGKKDYLELSKFFLEVRGDADNPNKYGPYSQDHIPVTQQDEVVGHSVRATYMYAAMTDIAAIFKDQNYRNAIDKLWKNQVSKKTYLTGGIGSLHDGEQYGANYELPNLTAYNETCAAIGSVIWNQRMFNLTGAVKYQDVMERTLYNAVISGISLNGTEFFYPNPLSSDGKYNFNRGACTRSGWFDCSCCPTNLIRFLPTLPSLIYATQNQSLYVNQYIPSTAQVRLSHTSLQIRQKTEYPWNGKITLTIDPEKTDEFSLKLRVPGWVRNEVLPSDLYTYTANANSSITIRVNGTSSKVDIQEGYVILRRQWNKGDTVTIEFPMKAQQVKSHSLVKENLGKRALEFGPLVYAVEEQDNPKNFEAIALSDKTTFKQTKSNALGGIYTLKAQTGKQHFTAIPYYAWSNRGVNRMKVWISEENK